MSVYIQKMYTQSLKHRNNTGLCRCKIWLHIFVRGMRCFAFSLSSLPLRPPASHFSFSLPFHSLFPFPSSLLPFLYPSPPFPFPNAATGTWGSAVNCPSGPGQSPDAKRNLVNSTVKSGFVRAMVYLDWRNMAADSIISCQGHA